MKNRNGFSLMEVMVVIGIIGIVSAFATPNLLAWLQNRKYNDSLQRTISVLNSARMRAIKENTNTIVQFDIGNNSFRAFVDKNNNEAWDNGIDRLIDVFEMPHGVEIESVTFGSDWIGFNGQGMPMDMKSGKIELKSSRGRSHEIEINITGRVKLS